LENNNFPLRVCYSQFRSFNCNQCEKCRRTITALTLEGIDPNEHGFNIDGNFFGKLKADITQGHVIKDLTDFLLWRDIQMHVPKKIDHDLYNSKVFFEWFRDFNIVKSIKNPEERFGVKWALFYVYYKSPKNVRQATAKLLRPYPKY